MVGQKTWNQKDPKEAKIIALTTQVEALRSQIVHRGGSNGDNRINNSNNQNGRSNGKFNTDIPEWRMKNVGPSKEVDGVQYSWCPHHKLEGVFDGLYMTHKPGKENDEWKIEKDRKRAEFKKRKDANKGTSDNSADNANAAKGDGNKNLNLSDKMKAVLMTKFNCSDEDAKNLVSDICTSDLN